MISGYAIAPSGTLTLVGSTPLSTAATSTITGTDVTISNDDRTLYVNESSNGTVAAFSLNDGTATQLAGSPYAAPFGAGSTTIGIADN
jgi:sugar lactone lactonase YvrE